MPGRIETLLTVVSGDRVAADGHLAVRRPAGGPGAWVPVEIAEGDHWFAAAAAALEAAIKAATGSVRWDVSVVDDEVTITSLLGNFDLRWEDEEAAQYFGFPVSETWLNNSAFTGTEPAAGRITFENPLDFEWSVRMLRKWSQRHDGAVGATLIGLRRCGDYSVVLGLDELAHAEQVLARVDSGIPCCVQLSAANATTWAMSSTAWTGRRVMCARSGGVGVDLGSVVSPPFATLRRVTIRLQDCEV
jgi:hypothetical protein